MDTTMKRTSDNTDRIVYRTLSRSHILLAYCFPSEGFLVASNATCECSAHQSFDISPLCNHLFTLLTSVSDWETDLTSVDAALCTKLHAWPLCTPRGVHYGVQVIAPTRRYDRRPPLAAVITSICSHNSTLSHCLLILASSCYFWPHHSQDSWSGKHFTQSYVITSRRKLLSGISTWQIAERRRNNTTWHRGWIHRHFKAVTRRSCRRSRDYDAIGLDCVVHRLSSLDESRL